RPGDGVRAVAKALHALDAGGQLEVLIARPLRIGIRLTAADGRQLLVVTGVELVVEGGLGTAQALRAATARDDVGCSTGVGQTFVEAPAISAVEPLLPRPSHQRVAGPVGVHGVALGVDATEQSAGAAVMQSALARVNGALFGVDEGASRVLGLSSQYAGTGQSPLVVRRAIPFFRRRRTVSP